MTTVQTGTFWVGNLRIPRKQSRGAGGSSLGIPRAKDKALYVAPGFLCFWSTSLGGGVTQALSEMETRKGERDSDRSQ